MDCKHTFKLKIDGLCKECKDKKPYYFFALCKDKCYACGTCGYTYGPDHPQAGEKVVWLK